jgi:hypothetical protein
MSGYVYHYDIQLLDDLHNYFPDILYAPQRFTSVGDLLAYIRERVRNRFDLFSAGQHDYNNSNTTTVQPSTPPPPPRADYTTRTPPVTIRPTVHPPPRTVRTSHSLLTELLIPRGTGELDIENTIFGLISGLGGLHVPQQGVMEPVIVRPTEQQIQENTSIEILDTEDAQCAICQDAMDPGTEVRSLDVCDHRFHVTCIDTWFTRDVHCPICRHDIREAAASST